MAFSGSQHRHGRHGHPTLSRSLSEQASSSALDDFEMVVEPLTAAESASVSALQRVYSGWWDSTDESVNGTIVPRFAERDQLQAQLHQASEFVTRIRSALDRVRPAELGDCAKLRLPGRASYEYLWQLSGFPEDMQAFVR
eukprot:SAG22_NODE_7381_length_745_cov_0.948916_2_plen_139_part_01